MRKFIGITLLLAGFAVLALFVMANLVRQDRQAEEGQVTVRVTETRDLDPYGSGGIGRGDAPRIILPTTAGSGRLFHVSGDEGPPGDGSRERPWRTLTEPLCRLLPGDRLVVLAGSFDGPVRIGDECSHGAPDKPVEVYFHGDVALRGGATQRAGAQPVLEIDRSHWTVAGLQVLPGRSDTAIAIAPGVEGVTLDSVKINRGAGVGVRIGHGAADIELFELHVHHMGLPAEDSVDGSDQFEKAELPGAAVMIEPGAKSVRILESKFHNIRGEMVRVIAPEDFESAPDLLPADYHIDEETYLSGQQDPWW